MTELYLQMTALQKKFDVERKKKMDKILSLNNYLGAMAKMERIVKEANSNSFDFLKYKQFYKEMDKNVLDLLKQKLETSHS